MGEQHLDALSFTARLLECFGLRRCPGSIAGRLAGYSTSLVYGAAKAAVIHLTRCVAMELGEAGIRVNSISPGLIATGIFGKALGLSVEAAEKTPGVTREIYRNAQPIPRAGLPEDIAQAAVWLASDASDYVTGTTLFVDGGMTLYPGFATGG